MKERCEIEEKYKWDLTRFFADDKAFFYGTGIHNTFRMVHFTNASPEVSSYKLAEQIGFQLFCGFVF